jgi:hypothetical protein
MEVGTAASATTPQVTDPPRRRWWVGHLRAMAAPVLVMLPLVAIAPMADNRFNPYRFGGEYAGRPWLVVTDQLTSIPSNLAQGDFRPLGRMLERSLDLLTFHVSTALTLPMNVAMRSVHVLAVGVFVVALVVLVETITAPSPLRRTPPSTATALLPFAFAAGSVAAGSLSTVVISTDLYLLSSALVLGVAAAAARHDWLTQHRLPVSGAIAAVLLGAALAAFNEVAYLAPPLAITAVLARGRLTMGQPWREIGRSAAGKATVLGWLGFLVVLVPIQAVIAANCADGSCYDSPTLATGAALVPALGHRLVSWLPLPAYWGVATATETDLWSLVRNPVTLLLVVALGAVAGTALRTLVRRRSLTSRELTAVTALGAATLLLGATMAATTEAVQELVADGWPLGSGWRDTQLTVTGGALLVTAAVLAVGRIRPVVVAGGLVGLAVLAASTLVANQGLAVIQAGREESEVHQRIAVAVTTFVDDEDGNAHRCRLLEDFVALHPDRDDWHVRLERALDAATRARHDRDFCTAEVAP